MNISGFDLTHTLAFVFDLDGTLVQSEHVWSKAKSTAAKKNGLKLTEADLEPFVGRSLNAFVSHFFMNFSDEQKNHLINEIQTNALSSLETEMMPIKGASELIKTIFENFHLTKRKQLFQDIEDKSQFDLIYFDAFGFPLQPELWSEIIFKKMFDALLPNGVLVTYACRTSIKNAMLSVGFSIEKLPGAPGKREMLRATKNV